MFIEATVINEYQFFEMYIVISMYYCNITNNHHKISKSARIE